MNPNDLSPEDQPRPSDEDIEEWREEMIEKADEMAEERGEYVRMRMVDVDDVYKHYTDVQPQIVANIDDYEGMEMVEQEEAVAGEI